MYFVHKGTAVKHLDVRFCRLDDPKKREDCGHRGITKQGCLDRLCCYDSTVWGVAWCFHGKYNSHLCFIVCNIIGGAMICR